MSPDGRSDDAGIPTPVWLCFGVCLLAFGAICALVVLRTSRFWYDETWYLATVDSLRRRGLTTEFLRGLPGPAGPLYTWVHQLLSPITRLRPLPTRLATVLLFALTIAALSLAGRLLGIRLAAWRAPQLLGAPMLYGSIGTALTEVPAMLAFSVHVAVLLLAVRSSERNRALGTAFGVLSGLCCGLAIAGRQTFLPAVLALPVLGWRQRAAWWPLAACALTSLVFPVALFAAWGGLTPPRTAFVANGFSPGNLVTAFAYAGLVYAVFDFAWIAERARLYGAIVLAGILLNLATGLLVQMPLLSTISHLVPARGLGLFARFSGGLFLGCGLVFMAKLASTLLESSSFERYLALGSILILGTALKVTIPYGGRYIAGSLPLLLLLALKRAPDTKWKAARLAVAASVGLVSLNTYIMHTLTLELDEQGQIIVPRAPASAHTPSSSAGGT